MRCLQPQLLRPAELRRNAVNTACQFHGKNGHMAASSMLQSCVVLRLHHLRTESEHGEHCYLAVLPSHGGL